VVHGFASSAAQFDRETNFEHVGTKRGYAVLSPDALGSPTNWNLFGTKGQPDDYAFVGALVGSVIRGACVDPGRVFIAGHSAGSAFSGFLVCRRPYRFAAVAMVSATVPSTCPRGVTPAVISVHGTADPAVPYAGGLGIGQTVPIPPVRTTIAQLAKDRNCTAPPTQTRVAGNVVRMRYRGCADGDDVELFTIERGGHLWSAGTTTRILDFFDAHQRP
jgi:polyhydroxybutyrate depolymerase